MGVGLVRAALTDAAEEITSRKTILEGNGVSTHRAGEPRSGVVTVAAAAATMETICREIDERIAAEIVPTDADYLRQVGLATSALDQLRDAMTELLSTQGGNGLRESGHFERRWRDLPMPLHQCTPIGHIIRLVAVLGEELEPF